MSDEPARTGEIEAIIFDLDGVIFDSEIWWREVREEFAARFGLTWTPADHAACMGANSRGWAAIMRDRLQLPTPLEEIERAVIDGVVARYRERGAPEIDGAVEAVRRLALTYPAAIASSSPHAAIDAALEAAGLTGIMRATVSSDDVPVGKPAPDVYLEAACRLGVEPARCLVVEDSVNGVRAGRAAGMRVVLVPNASIAPAPGSREAATYVIERLADLDPASLGRGKA